MRLYLDTEFNGFGGELMSIGIVSDSGEAFYRVVEISGPIEPWVQENVVPVLYDEPTPLSKARYDLHEWLQQFNNPTIVVDWYTDAVHFFSLFQGEDHSESLDYPCKLELVRVDYVSKIPHNALNDAVAIRDALNEKAA